jgi:exosortase/archaeosortase family protein
VDRSETVASNVRIHWAGNRLSSLLEIARREPAAVAFLVALSAICLDYAIAPVLNTVTPAFACALFLLLLWRRNRSITNADQSLENHGVTLPRVLLFLLLHAGIVTLAIKAGSTTIQPSLAVHFSKSAAVAKYLVLLPAVFLMPLKQWRNIIRVYGAEFAASALVLLTVDPYRIFATAWPWYCQWLGRFSHALASPFVAGLAYIPLPTPTLIGPNLDVRILFACSGLEAIKLFQIVFAVMLVLDWTHLNKQRTFIAYFAGMAAMLVANAVRIALLAITGNLAPRLAIQHHLTLGWIFFAFVAALLIIPLYSWVMPRRVPAALATT